MLRSKKYKPRKKGRVSRKGGKRRTLRQNLKKRRITKKMMGGNKDSYDSKKKLFILKDVKLYYRNEAGDKFYKLKDSKIHIIYNSGDEYVGEYVELKPEENVEAYPVQNDEPKENDKPGKIVETITDEFNHFPDYNRHGKGIMFYKNSEILCESTWKDDNPVKYENSRVYFKESQSCAFIGNISLDNDGKLSGNGTNIFCYSEIQSIEYIGKWKYENGVLTGDGEQFKIRHHDDDHNDYRDYYQKWKIDNNEVKSVELLKN